MLYVNWPQRSFWNSAGSLVPEIVLEVAYVEPPVKFASAVNAAPLPEVYAPPPLLIRAVVPACVVNVQLTGPASAVPSAALIEAARLAVYDVEKRSGTFGVSVAVFVAALYETVAATGVAPFAATVKLELVIVVASMAREKVAVTVDVATTPVAPAAGVVEVTVGGFDVAAVVKLQLKAPASGVPSDALAPVVIVAV